MSSDRSLQLRAQEIMQANPGEIAAADAIKQALNERYEGDLAAIVDFASIYISKSMGALKVAAYELDDSQGVLFSLPTTIVVDTDRGSLTGDAVVLARCLRDHPTLERAFSRFEAERRPRVPPA